MKLGSATCGGSKRLVQARFGKCQSRGQLGRIVGEIADTLQLLLGQISGAREVGVREVGVREVDVEEDGAREIGDDDLWRIENMTDDEIKDTFRRASH